MHREPDVQSTTWNFEAVLDRNAHAYTLLFQIEVLLREIIAIQLFEEHGSKWVKRSLPPDVRKKISDTVGYERQIPWPKLLPHHPLYYADFPDLKKLIVIGTNWPKSFEAVFVNKSSVDTDLSDIEAIRNKIAHNRFVIPNDITILEGTLAKIIGAVPPAKIAQAKTALSTRVPLVDVLRSAAEKVASAKKAMEAGTALQFGAAEAFAFKESWWLDADYLGRSVEVIDTFAAACLTYESIYPGVGQALARRRWVAENGVLSTASEAEELVSQLLEDAERQYA